MSKSNPFFKDVTVPGTLTSHITADAPYETDGDPRKILIVAGVHGNEHNAVLAAYRVYQELKQERDPKCRNKHDIRFILGVNKWGLLKTFNEGKFPTYFENPLSCFMQAYVYLVNHILNDHQQRAESLARCIYFYCAHISKGKSIAK